MLVVTVEKDRAILLKGRNWNNTGLQLSHITLSHALFGLHKLSVIPIAMNVQMKRAVMDRPQEIICSSANQVLAIEFLMAPTIAVKMRPPTPPPAT